MMQLEEKNPLVYNQILAGLTSVAQESTKREGAIIADQNGVALISKLISNSTPKDDAVIAAVSGNNPNSTALAQAIWSTYEKIAGKNPTDTDTKKALVFLNDIFKEVYSAGNITTGLERSIALKSFAVLPIIQKMASESGWG